MTISGKSVALGSLGGLFIYSGLSGFSVLKAAQNVISGQPANAGQTATLLSSGSSGGLAGGAPGGTIGPGAAKAKAWAKAHLADYGWGPEQFAPLDSLWMGESGWRWDAQNPKSPAYGIPQSDPGDKMSSEGPDWKTNPVTQMRWGLKYIKQKYGTPAAAYSFWLAQSPHWY